MDWRYVLLLVVMMSRSYSLMTLTNETRNPGIATWYTSVAWNAQTSTAYLGTVTSYLQVGTAASTPIFSNAWASIDQLAVDSSRNAVFFCTENNAGFWRGVNPTNSGTVAYTPQNSGSKIRSCVFDIASGYMWAAVSRTSGGNTQLYIERVPLSTSSWTPKVSPSLPGRGQNLAYRNCGAYDAARQFVYFCGGSDASTTLWRIPAFWQDGVSTSSWPAAVGAGTVISLAIQSNQMYLGTSEGFGFNFLLSNTQTTFNGFLFSSFGSLTGVLVDPSTYVTYWTTSQPSIIRWNPGENTPADNLTLPAVPLPIGILRYPWKSDLPSAVFADGSRDYGKAINYIVTLAQCDQFTTCSSCVQGDPQYCGWCLESATCTVLNSCSPTSRVTNTTSCPQLTTIAPASGSTDGRTSIRLVANSFGSSPSQMQCRFTRGATSVNVSVTNPTSTSVTCQTPPAAAGTTTVDVVFKGQIWASNTLDFDYYDCGTASNCGGCKSSSRPECGWCLSSVTCSTNVTCQPSTTSVCPQFSVSPASSAQGSNVMAVLTGNQFTSPGTYTVIAKSTSTQSGVIPVTYVNQTTLTLTLPSSLPVGTYDLQLQFNNKLYVTPVGSRGQFTYYNCQSENLCDTCNSPLKPGCTWCAIDQKCSSKEQCTGSQIVSVCPAIVSTSPPSAYVTGNVSVNVNVVGTVFPNGTLACVFGTNTSVNASWVQYGSVIRCQVPPATQAGNVFLAISVGGKIVTNSITFTYFDCDSQTNCTACLSPLYVGTCTWCFQEQTCQKSSNLSPNCIAYLNSTCPTLTSVTSPIYRGDTATNVVITGTQFVQSNNYTCSEDGDLPATWINSQTINCTLDPFEMTTTLQQVPVNLYLNGMSYAVNSVNVTYYDCLLSWDTCQTCVNSSLYCGWCITSAGCSADVTCQDPAGWWTKTCPTIQRIAPAGAPLTGGQVEIVGTHLSVPSPMCQFDDMLTNATVFNSTVITCQSPAVQNASQVSFSVVYQLSSRDLQPYTPTYNFAITNCGKYDTCQSCASDEANFDLCGWCPYTFTCSFSWECPSNWTQRTNTCPMVTTIRPSVGTWEGGVPTEIIGDNFLPGFLYGVKFLFSGPKRQESEAMGTQVEYVNSTRIRFLTPAGVNGSSVQVQLFANSTLFAFNPDLEYYYSAPVPAGSDLNLAAVIGGVVGGLVFIIVLIILISVLLWRRRVARERVQLVVPKYDVIAYGNWLESQYDKKGKWTSKTDMLEQIILDPEMTLAVALGNITQTTETDPLSRALVFIFESHDKALNLIHTYVDLEVGKSQTSTLFRNNSIATKMFKFYSRMVGSEYLFNTLGRFIAELDFSSRKDYSKDKNELINTGIDIELDPHRRVSGRISSEDISSLQDEDSGFDDTAISKLQLELVAQRLFNLILKSANNVPPSIVEILRHVRSSVSSAFENSENSRKIQSNALSAFFFLRFVCPSIAAPHAYGLLPAPPSDACQRQLVLLSKVLQNIANETRFGAKEEFMAQLNTFVEMNIINLQKFYDQMFAQQKKYEISRDPVPKTVKENSLAWVHNHVTLNNVKLDTELTTFPDFSDGQEVKNKLKEAMEQMGDPPTKIKNAPVHVNISVTE